MKPIKMFGLAALMAMAFVGGASSAMAEDTLLCTADESPCEEANAVGSVHEVSVGKATLLSSVINIECEVLFEGTAYPYRDTSAETVEGTFTYSSCNSNCVVKEENGPSELEVLKEGHEKAKVTGIGLIHVVCSGFIDCSYDGASLVGVAIGPLLSTQENGEVSLQKQTVTKEAGGFLCPKTTTLDIVMSPLVATYISGALHYCVDYEHNTNGFYSDNACTNGPVAGRRYDLVPAPRGIPLGTAVCIRVPAGLWKEVVAGVGVCLKDTTLTGGSFEKGTIVRVQ